MNGDFDFDKYTTTTDFSVNVTDVVIRDNRTDRTFRKTFYRPGEVFPITHLLNELSRLGYEIVTVNTETTIVQPGRMNWQEVFTKFFVEEGQKKNDRPEL